MGVLGLIAYVLLSTGYLLIVSTAFVAGYVLPSLAETDPDYVNGVLAVAAGGTADQRHRPRSQYALAAEGITYLAGGLLFGIALFRARVLPAGAQRCSSAGAVFTVSLSVLPESLYRLLAYPNAIALIALGYSLWRAGEHPSSTPGSGGATHTSPRPVGAS